MQLDFLMKLIIEFQRLTHYYRQILIESKKKIINLNFILNHALSYSCIALKRIDFTKDALACY